MIVSIEGKLTKKGERFLVLENNGIGYQVYATPAVIASHKEGETVGLLTYHHVTEAANELYGFPTQQGVDFFATLLTIAGIGPKSALNVLSVASIEELQQAIKKDDPTLLTKVSGIGKKTAERIVVELKEKVLAPEDEGTMEDDVAVLDALVSLGYKRSDARDVVRTIPPTVVGVSERVREALKHLGGHAG